MPAINIKQMKITEPSRNFDATVNAETNIPAEDSTGLSGGFKFFTGIKAFFKGISALGTLTTTSRIPVTDSNGNVTYTTVADINNLVNSVNIVGKTGSTNDLIPSSDNKIFSYYGSFTDTPFSASGTKIVTSEFINANGGIYQTCKMYGLASDNYAPIQYSRYGYKNGDSYSWSSWRKLVTETDTPTYKTVTVTTNENGAILSITGVDLTKVLSVSCTSDADLICTIFNGSYQYIRVRTYQGTNKANTSVTLNLVLKR